MSKLSKAISLNIIKDILLMALIAAVCFWFIFLKDREKDVFTESNIEALSGKTERYINKSGHEVVTAPVQRWDPDQLETLRSDLIESVKKELDIKLKRISSITNIHTETEKRIVTAVRDSTINDTVQVKVFMYKDKWNSVKGIIINDKAITDIKFSDSLTSVVYWDRKWFLGRKHYKQKITNVNPFFRINFTEHIEVKKR